MKNAIFAIILASISAGASAAVTCTNMGGMTVCNGFDQSGQPVNTTTYNSGSMSTTTGTVGGAPISSTTTQIGNMTVTNGSVDGQPFSQTCSQFGNMTTCN
ncbi:hypothetical protein NAD41_002346 [Salmonella enterica]|nr:hypothetical protein [Salmonella enterica]EKK6596314.1 hypothetical protein [Salmonella enterica]